MYLSSVHPEEVGSTRVNLSGWLQQVSMDQMPFWFSFQNGPFSRGLANHKVKEWAGEVAS